MAKQYKDWFPKNEAEQKDFLENFRQEFPAIGANLGFTTAQVTEITDGIVSTTQKYIDVADAKEIYDSKLAIKEEDVPVYISTVLRPLVANLKTNPAYTDGMGALLHIVGTSTPFDPTSYVAEGSVTAQLNEVTFKFKKGGATAVNIYGRRKGEGEFKRIIMVTNSPYTYMIELTDGKPETWEYYLRGMLKNVEIGAPSDTMAVQVGTR